MYIKLLQTRPTLDCIIDTVCKRRNQNRRRISSMARFRKYVLTRNEIAFIARLFGYYQREIAAKLYRDHSTIVYMVRAFANDCDTNHAFRSAYETAWREVYAEAFDVKPDFNIHKSNILKQYYRAVI